MTNGIKTTLEERMKIVTHCIDNGRNYSKTVKQYGVSYQQIYSWVRKFEKDGSSGLIDGRGRKSQKGQLDADRLYNENIILKERIAALELELALLKKSNK